jgi:hypothetical protein
MTAHDLKQAVLEHLGIEHTGKAKRHWDVIKRAVWYHLAQKPEALLGE